MPSAAQHDLRALGPSVAHHDLRALGPSVAHDDLRALGPSVVCALQATHPEAERERSSTAHGAGAEANGGRKWHNSRS
jgi:hypothetical protein